MPREKLPTELDDADLLAIAEKEGEENVEDIFDYTNDVVPFLSFYKIKPGRNIVAKRFLYELYKTWSDDPIETRSLALEMGKFLPTKKSSETPCFLINTTAMNISQELYKLVMKHSRPKFKNKTYKTHIEAYFKYYNIRPGKSPIASTYMLDLYNRWTDKNGQQHMSKIQFHKCMKLYFEHKKTHKGYYFLINRNLNNIQHG